MCDQSYRVRSVLLCMIHRYELKWIRGKCERAAKSGVFRSVSQVYTIGHMRLPELIRIQCFKSASQSNMLDWVFEVMNMGR